MRRAAIVILFVMYALSCVAQSGAEVDALTEMFFAKELKTVMKHLPPELVKAMEAASPQTQRGFGERFMIGRMLEQGDRVKITRPESGPALVIEEKSPREDVPANRVEIYLDKRMSDGTETMLRFKLKTPHEEEWAPTRVATFYMRYVEGEWRLYEIEADRDSVKLDDPKFIAKITSGNGPRGMSGNEATAVGSMRTLNTAAVTYAATYPDIGYPAAIAAMVAAGNEEPSPEHAGLIEPILGSGEKSGYRFTYVPKGKEGYSITGRPLEFGVTGTRSFYTDESGVIRSTNEDRQPTIADEPLQ